MADNRPLSPTAHGGTSHLSLDSVEEILPLLSDRADVELSVRNGEARVQCMESEELRTFITVDDEFPDYSEVVEHLPRAVSRTVLPQSRLLSAVESQRGQIRLTIVDGGLDIDSGGEDSGGESIRLPAMSWGPVLSQSFDAVLLHPVLEQSVGPDVVLEMSSETGPLRVRSADTSDLLSVLMPVAPAAPARIGS